VEVVFAMKFNFILLLSFLIFLKSIAFAEEKRGIPLDVDPTLSQPDIEKLEKLSLNDNRSALYKLQSHYSHVGDSEKSFYYLKRIAYIVSEAGTNRDYGIELIKKAKSQKEKQEALIFMSYAAANEFSGKDHEEIPKFRDTALTLGEILVHGECGIEKNVALGKFFLEHVYGKSEKNFQEIINEKPSICVGNK
jgi:hypothetical protein